MRILTIVNDRDSQFHIAFSDDEDARKFLMFLEPTTVGVLNDFKVDDGATAEVVDHIHQWDYEKDYETGNVRKSCLDPNCEHVEFIMKVRD